MLVNVNVSLLFLTELTSAGNGEFIKKVYLFLLLHVKGKHSTFNVLTMR